MITNGTRVYTRYRVVQHTLIITLGGRWRVLSSAPQGGGLCHASSILNHQVEANSGPQDPQGQGFEDPSRYLRKLAASLGVIGETVGLMTAVPMTQLVTARASSGALWVECFATVGVTNAVQAGEWLPQLATRRRRIAPGTINLIVITNGSLSDAAMVGVVQVVTEAKTGMLRDHLVTSCYSGLNATGTGTDAVVIACRGRGQGPRHRYSGTHTIVGALIGQAVADCVSRGLEKAKRWQERHQ